MKGKAIKILFAICMMILAASGSYEASAETISRIELYPATIEYDPWSWPTPITLMDTTNGKAKERMDNKLAVWSSSNPTVATVTSDGAISLTGYKGTAVITATYGKLKATMTAITNFKLVMREIQFTTEEQELVAETLTNNGFWVDQEFQWSGSNPEVAVINNDRKTITFTGKKGVVTIKVSCGGVSATRTINVAPVLNIQEIAFTTGSAVTVLEAYAKYDPYTVLDITSQVAWSSSNKNVATITADGKGIVFTGKPGTTKVSCSYGSQRVDKTITVEASYMIPEEFQYSDQPVSLSVAANYGVLEAVKVDASTVVWTSSNKLVATVDQNGTVSFTGKTGLVRIVATVLGKYTTQVEAFVGPQIFLK